MEISWIYQGISWCNSSISQYMIHYDTLWYTWYFMLSAVYQYMIQLYTQHQQQLLSSIYIYHNLLIYLPLSRLSSWNIPKKMWETPNLALETGRSPLVGWDINTCYMYIYIYIKDETLWYDDILRNIWIHEWYSMFLLFHASRFKIDEPL